MHQINDPVLRLQLWNDLYYGVRAGRSKSTTFLNLILSNLPKESNPTLIGSILNRSITVLARYTPETLIDEFADDLFDLFLGLALTASQKDVHTTILSGVVAAAWSKVNVIELTKV
jgi:hypothetical protein